MTNIVVVHKLYFMLTTTILTIVLILYNYGNKSCKTYNNSVRETKADAQKAVPLKRFYLSPYFT